MIKKLIVARYFSLCTWLISTVSESQSKQHKFLKYQSTDSKSKQFTPYHLRKTLSLSLNMKHLEIKMRILYSVILWVNEERIKLERWKSRDKRCFHFRNFLFLMGQSKKKIVLLLMDQRKYIINNKYQILAELWTNS